MYKRSCSTDIDKTFEIRFVSYFNYNLSDCITLINVNKKLSAEQNKMKKWLVAHKYFIKLLLLPLLHTREKIASLTNKLNKSICANAKKRIFYIIWISFFSFFLFVVVFISPVLLLCASPYHQLMSSLFVIILRLDALALNYYLLHRLKNHNNKNSANVTIC